jgi:hypothetical protein
MQNCCLKGEQVKTKGVIFHVLMHIRKLKAAFLVFFLA